MAMTDCNMEDEIAGWGRRCTGTMRSWDSFLEDFFPGSASVGIHDWAEDYVREVYDLTWGHRRPGAE